MNYDIKLEGKGNRDQLATRLIDLARAIQSTKDGDEIDLERHRLNEDDGIMKIEIAPDLFW